MSSVDDYKKQLSVLVNSSTEGISQFNSPKSITQPSIILKKGIDELGITRLTPREIEQYLLLHPVIPRGIQIKANRMTSRGYSVEPFDNSRVAKEAARRCEELIEEAGGILLINGWIQDAYAFGNSYLTLLTSEDNESEIMYLSREHPMFFRIAREKREKDEVSFRRQITYADFTHEWGAMKINPATKKPLAYVQVVPSRDNPLRVVPDGSEINPGRVAHLVFDTWGDEAEGISLVQYVFLHLKYLMNIEEAGAEAIYRSGFTQKAVQTEIINENDLEELGRNLSEINSADTIILPKGTTVTNLLPSDSQFPDVHDKFMNLIAIRLGIPKPVLTLDGTSTNKATIRELMKDLVHDLGPDEMRVEQTINKQIFTPACESWFGDGFEKFPTFKFKQFNETLEERAETMSVVSEYVKRLTESYVLLSKANQQPAANRVLRFMVDSLPLREMKDFSDEDDVVIDEPEKPKVPNHNFNPLVDEVEEPVTETDVDETLNPGDKRRRSPPNSDES